MPTPLNRPATMLQPFANSGDKNVIPDQPDATPGHASLKLGFPPLTMTRIESGGVPPSGKDFNGILNAITQHTAWLNAGGKYRFDANLATYLGGYSAGMVLQSDDGLTEYISIVDNNTTNFNSDPTSIGVKWALYAGDLTRNGVTTIATTGGATTLTAAQFAKPIIIVTGALTSNAVLTLPAAVGTWRIINKTTGAFTLTAVSSGSGATPLIITQGKTDTVLANGVDLVFPNWDSGLDSPAFRGVPTAPTAAPTTNTGQLATTAFVQAGIAAFGANSVPQYKTAGFTAGVTGDYWTDTSAGAFTMTLPDPPVGANPLRVQDIAGTWGINNLTINAGTKTILGLTSPLVCDVAGELLELWYNGTDWRLV